MKQKSFFLMILLMSLPVLAWSDFRQTLYFSTQKAGKVPFEHELHLSRLNSNCSACHNSIFHIVRKNNKPTTMKEMEGKKSCGACHNKENPQYAQLNACTKCHKVGIIQIRVTDFGSVPFSHPKHLEMYSCTDCHDTLFKTSHDNNSRVTMAQMEKGVSCGSCHDGSTAFSVKGDCVKCHQVGDVKMPGQSVFSHKKHLEMSYDCKECHKSRFIPGANRFFATMLDMEQGKSCGGCHDGSTAFSVKGDCIKCHSQIGIIPFKAFNARFDHQVHTAMFKCNECHSGIFVGGTRSIRYSMIQMEKGASCGACHEGKTAFTVAGNCDKCHVATFPDVKFPVKDSGKVVFSHANHRIKFACNDCHNKTFNAGKGTKRFSMAQMEKGESCGTCHNGKTAFPVKNCNRCHPVKEILFSDDARFSHDKHLEMYSCQECHNKIYNASANNKRHNMQQMEKGSSCGTCHDGNTAFTAKGDCDKCHRTTVNIVFEVKETGKTLFSHAIHSGMYKCVDCHSSIFVAGKSSQRYTMAQMEKGSSCGACHDGKTAFGVKDACTKCHVVKKIHFKPGSAVFPHDVHVAAYNCKDCHPGLFIPGAGNKRFTMIDMEKGEACGSCHDSKTAFSVKGDCEKCHPGTPRAIRYELAATTGNVEFSHAPHLGRGYSCNSCHYQIVPSGLPNKRWLMKDMDQGLFCGACHGASMAFSVKSPASCERCHQKESDWRPPSSK